MRSLTIVIALFAAGSAYGQTVFPGSSWQETTPEAQGVDSTKLNAAMNYLASVCGSQGTRQAVVIRNGYLIWKGNDIDNRHNVWSCSKSFTSTILGLLIDDGKCTLNTLAKDHVSSLASQYSGVRLRHFATMTSGYDGGGDQSSSPFNPTAPLFSPGSKYQYWDSAMNQFGNVLTRIAGEPIEDLFKRRIADKIGMNRSKWDWGDWGTVSGMLVNGGAGNKSKGIHISAREMARFGHLFLNRGKWNGTQIISASWVDAASKAQVAASVPARTSGADGPGVYGYNWWTNGIKPDGKRLWPLAPPRAYKASGHNNNCWVIPEWNMVIVRQGTDGNTVDNNEWSTFFDKVDDSIGAASTNPPPTVSLTAPANGASYTTPAGIAMAATASDDGSVAQVEFLVDGSVKGTDTSSPYTYTWNTSASGTYVLSARATDDQGATATSNTRTVTVTAPVNQPPSPSISSPSNGQTFETGSTLSFSGSASDPEDGTLTGSSLTWWIDRIGDGLAAAQLPATGTSGSQVLSGTISGVDLGVVGSEYDLILRATDSQGLQAVVKRRYSVTAPAPQPPSAPTGLSASSISSSRIDLAWTDTSSNESGFEIERSSGGGFSRIATAGAGVTSHSDTGLAPATVHTYRVRAVNGAGASGYSNTDSATTLSSGGSGIISGVSPSGYLVDTLDVGKGQYVDRPYTFTGVPGAYVGMDFIRTANDDKSSQGFPWLTFTVGQDVTVYVAHDDRIAADPLWMLGFVDAGDDLVSGGETFSLWAKDYPAGTVDLGGNIESGSSSFSMYTVVVGPPTGSGTTDSDGDGLSDLDETNLYYTNPQLADTDGDGTNDGTEVAQGTDPLDASSFPGSGIGSGGGGNGSGGGCGATGLEVLAAITFASFFRRRARPRRSGGGRRRS